MSIERARHYRATRASTLDRIGKGSLSLRDALLETPDELTGVTIYTLLLAFPGVGPQAAKHLLQDAVVWPMDKVSSLTLTERKRIIDKAPRSLK